MSDYYTRTLGEASASALKEFRISPLHYLHWCKSPDWAETKAMHEGTAIHMALHEPERFARRYFTIPDMPLRSEADKQAFLDATGVALGIDLKSTKADALREKVARELAKRGTHILTESELSTLRAMIDSLNLPCHNLARSIASRGKKEHEIRWIDAETGIQCKARIDSWDEQTGIESDLKRTASITEREFRRAIYNFGYHFQRAFYRRGLRALGADVRYQCFVCGSPEAPHPWAVYDIPAEIIDECDAQISSDLRSLAECLAKNDFPTINAGQARTIDMRAA